MAAHAMIPFLVAMMLLTGVCNTLLTKYQDMQCVRNCDDIDPAKRAYFNQPVMQTAQMFVGEMGCWLVVGLIHLCQQAKAKYFSEREGYQAVRTHDADDDREEEQDHEDEYGGDGSEPTAATTPLVEGRNSDDDEARKPAGHDHANAPVLRGKRILLLALPAISDICGTTLMNIGLLLVVASIFQMTRGALVLFVGLFSVIFLRRHLYLFQWISLVGVVAGVAVVGLAGVIYREDGDDLGSAKNDLASRTPSDDALLAIVGVLLIAGAQIFTATQFVLEEHILERWAIEPLKVVGWEGVFGFCFTLVGMFILHLAIGRTEAGRYGYFDIVEAWRQMTTIKEIGLSSILIMISIGGFNFFGLSVTRSVSATSRSTIDTCRTLFIWMVSLGLGWETFKWLQVVGFALLVYFTFLFNGIVQPPFEFLKPRREVETLLPEEPIEHR